MVWLDILVIGILVLFGLLGFIKGFMRTFLSLFSTLVTLVLAIWLAKPLSGLFDSWFGLTASIGGSLEPTFLNFFSTNDYTGGWIAQLIAVFLGSDYLSTNPPVETLSADFAFKVGNLITIVICVIILYILIRIVLFILSKIVSKLTKSRGISVLDRIFGTTLGLAKGFLYIFIAMAIVFCLGSFITPLGAWVDNMLGQNPVAETFYGWVKSLMQNTILPFFFG